MMFKSGILVVIGILFQVHSISARGDYYIDSTCQGTTRQFATQEITLAIQRANVASIGLGTPTLQPSSNVKIFISWLFAQTPITSLYYLFGGGGGLPVPNVGIKNLIYNAGQISAAQANDVIFSCDTSNFGTPKYASSSDWIYDGVLKRYAYIPGGINDCNYAPLDGPATAAITTVNPSTQINHVTLCPAGLVKAQGALFADLAAIPQGFQARMHAWISVYGRQPPKMDELYLFESTILHELTHTTVGGQKADVAGADSYNWNNAIRLSSIPGSAGAENNADNYVYLALAIALDNEGDVIYQNGNVADTASPSEPGSSA